MKLERFLPMITPVFESKIEFMNKNMAIGNHLCLFAAQHFDSLGGWLLPHENRRGGYFLKLSCDMRWSLANDIQPAFSFVVSHEGNSLQSQASVDGWHRNGSFSCTVNVAQQVQHPLLWGDPSALSVLSAFLCPDVQISALCYAQLCIQLHLSLEGWLSSVL